MHTNEPKMAKKWEKEEKPKKESKVRSLIKKMVREIIDEGKLTEKHKLLKQTKVDSKTRLQEFSLKKFKKLPIYKLIENSGPRHKPIFKIEVKIKNTKSTVGKGFSKKDAEQNAATQLLKNINLI